MFSSSILRGPFKTFYFVFAYIIVFTLWWAYLLYDKNETAFRERVELNKIADRQNGTGSYLATEQYQKLLSKYQRQKLMILSEAAVFVLLLLFGLMQVRRVFLREMALAKQQHNFLLSITHELKSPLSSIKLSLQTFNKRKDLDQEHFDKLLDNSQLDLERLETLVDNILFAAKIEHGDPGFSNAEIDASEIVHQAAQRFSHNKKSIRIIEDIEAGSKLNADPVGFSSVVNNLIENAIKYSDTASEVTVKLKSLNESLNLEVQDTGIGIPEDERENIFEKFYRIGNENTRQTKGTGLGLYIVKRFADIYQASISVAGNSPKGTIFRLSFPLNK